MSLRVVRLDRKFLAQVEGLLSHMARRLCFGINLLHQENREVIHGADLLRCRVVLFGPGSDSFGCRAIWYCSREGFFLHNKLIVNLLKVRIKILLILVVFIEADAPVYRSVYGRYSPTTGLYYDTEPNTHRLPYCQGMFVR